MNFHHLIPGWKKILQTEAYSHGFVPEAFGRESDQPIARFSYTSEKFIFRYKGIGIRGHYTPFTLSVFPDKTKFMILPSSLSLAITSGSSKTVWKCSICATQSRAWQIFQRSFTLPEEFEPWPSRLLPEGRAVPSEGTDGRELFSWWNILLVHFSGSHHFHQGIRQLWRYLFTYVSSV